MIIDVDNDDDIIDDDDVNNDDGWNGCKVNHLKRQIPASDLGQTLVVLNCKIITTFIIKLDIVNKMWIDTDNYKLRWIINKWYIRFN